MKSIKAVLILLLIILVFGCKEQAVPKFYPSDYLFMQRSFPHNDIDVKAYRSAIKNRSNYILNRKSNFESPWENIGPFNSDGRITDLELHPQNDNIIYAGSASGGIYKSIDNGNDWTPIFDESNALAIGDLAICKNNPNIIYAGTGESNAGGGSLAYDGQGVFRSDDDGESWRNIGLENIGSIGRVVVDPNDPDIAFVAGMGSLFKNNPERGIFRTSDGGENWDHVLMVSDSTGGIDLAMHPENGDIVYAAMWERIRRPEFRQYGGLTSGIYRSLDGGDSWIELTNGLPEIDDKGRIGLAISESSPNIIYAYYLEGSGQIEGIYKSEDGGDSWIEKSIQGITGTSFNWWFGKIFVDPNDSNKVIVTSLTMFMSTDGAESWQQIFPGVHADQHAVAISRFDSNKLFIGNDGGVYLTQDGFGNQWEYKNGLGNYQFYTCTIDPNDPDIIYGGAQDNGTLRSLQNDGNWESLFGGDGFRTIIDPDDSNQIYLEFQFGNIFRTDNNGNTFRSVTNGLGGNFNWNTPIAMDPNDSNVLYTGSQALFQTLDEGESWKAISPILVNPDNLSGNLTFGSLTTIDVSTFDSNVIYVGTDDGNVWVTQDKGENFINISEGLPKRWITSVSHDPHNDSGVYVTVSGFRFGENDAQVFYSQDFGENWAPIGNTLPDVPVNDLVADTRVVNRLYLATDIGVFYTEDQGEEWIILGTEMPILPIIDLDYHEESNILVAASYGRGMFKFNLPMTSNVSQVNEINFNVFPVPFLDNVSIESESVITNIELYNNLGQKLKSFKNERTLDLSFLETGLYELVIYSGDNKSARSIVKY